MSNAWRSRLRAACSLLCALGLLIAAWPLAQNGYAAWSQRALHRAWQGSRGAEETAGHKSAAFSRSLAPPLLRSSARSWPPTRLQIPDIGLDVVVVADADDASLRQGPGHLPESGSMGSGNCVIAGHSNIYGAPFGRLNEVETGAVIRLKTPRRTWTYHALQRHLASDADLSVLAPPPPGTSPLLTLITCTVPHGAMRVVLVASLEAG